MLIVIFSESTAVPSACHPLTIQLDGRTSMARRPRRAQPTGRSPGNSDASARSRADQEWRSAVGLAEPSLSVEGRYDTETLSVRRGRPGMPENNAQTESDGFSAAERAAMKKRAAELRAEGKKGAKKADGLQAVLDSIAAMAPEDRALAERVHVTVTATAPDLSPKTWYGMPAYATEDGKVVVFCQNAGKFSYRYSTLGFQEAANLDDGDMWPVSYALEQWTPLVEKKVAELVRAAIS